MAMQLQAMVDLLSKPKSATAKNLFETQIFSSLNRVIMASKPLLRIFKKHLLNLGDSREWRVALKLDLVINHVNHKRNRILLCK